MLELISEAGSYVRSYHFDEEFDDKIIVIQRLIRGWLVRKKHSIYHAAAKVIQIFVRDHNLKRFTQWEEMDKLDAGRRAKALPKEVVQSLWRIKETQTRLHVGVDLSELLALSRHYNVLQSQNYLEYHSAILALLNSMLREMTLNGVDTRTATCLNIQLCIKILRQHGEYHRFHSSLKLFQDSIRFRRPLRSLGNMLHPYNVAMVQSRDSYVMARMAHYANIHRGFVLLQGEQK
jgi:hypothetical protein